MFHWVIITMVISFSGCVPAAPALLGSIVLYAMCYLHSGIETKLRILVPEKFKASLAKTASSCSQASSVMSLCVRPKACDQTQHQWSKVCSHTWRPASHTVTNHKPEIWLHFRWGREWCVMAVLSVVRLEVSGSIENKRKLGNYTPKSHSVINQSHFTRSTHQSQGLCKKDYAKMQGMLELLSCE